MLNTITLNLYNFSGAGGDQHVIEGEMVNLPEPSIDAPCPPDYSSYDEIAADYASGNQYCFEGFRSVMSTYQFPQNGFFLFYRLGRHA